MQLRWLITKKPKYFNGVTTHVDVKVLQYRTRVYAETALPLPPGLVKIGAKMLTPRKVWSEWQDVPEVRE